MIKNLIEKLKKQNWTFTFIGTDDLDVENIAMDMGIDNHLQFSEDEAGTKKMFARENRARERYNKCRAMDCKMEVGIVTLRRNKDFPLTHFAVLPEGIVLTYHPYQIDCFAAGEYHAVIPFKEANKCLMFDYSKHEDLKPKLQRFIK